MAAVESGIPTLVLLDNTAVFSDRYVMFRRIREELYYYVDGEYSATKRQC